MSDTNTSAVTTNEPIISDEQRAYIDTQAQQKAEAIATQKVEQMKSELAEQLSGKTSRYGKSGPESWEKLHDEIKTDAVTEAEKRIMDKIEARDKEKEAKQQQTVKQQEESNKAEMTRMSTEWQEAVKDKIIPDIAEPIKAKLRSNVQFSDLTPEEQNDPGLKAYNDARLLHIDLRQKGESTSFYRTIDKFYNKQPAGAKAPVFGGNVATKTSPGELQYSDIAANRKKRFGF